MVNTEELNKVIILSGKKKEYLAKKCHITRHSLTNKINNRTDFKGDEIEILCKEVGITTVKEKQRIFFA